jgi:hypothetical protein
MPARVRRRARSQRLRSTRQLAPRVGRTTEDQLDDQRHQPSNRESNDPSHPGQRRRPRSKLPHNVSPPPPIAFRIPISRVRSVTETSIVFITPIPPTSNPTDEIATIATATPNVIERKVSMIESAVDCPETVRLVERNLAPNSQQLSHLIDPLPQIIPASPLQG